MEIFSARCFEHNRESRWNVHNTQRDANKYGINIRTHTAAALADISAENY